MPPPVPSRFRTAKTPAHTAGGVAACGLAVLATLAACGDAPMAPLSPIDEPRTLLVAPEVLELSADARFRNVLAIQDSIMRGRLATAVTELDEALRAGQRHRSEMAVARLLAVLPPEAEAVIDDGPVRTIVPVSVDDRPTLDEPIRLGPRPAPQHPDPGDGADLAAIRLAAEVIAAKLTPR